MKLRCNLRTTGSIEQGWMQGMEGATNGIELDTAPIVDDDATTQRRLARLLVGLNDGTYMTSVPPTASFRSEC